MATELEAFTEALIYWEQQEAYARTQIIYYIGKLATVQEKGVGGRWNSEGCYYE